jgi:hypothetical protein
VWISLDIKLIFIFCYLLLHYRVLDLVQGHDAFLGLSFAVRIVEALGTAGTLTATFAIIAAEFPLNVATTFVS